MRLNIFIGVLFVLLILLAIALDPIVTGQGDWRVVLMQCNGALGGTYNGGRDDRFFPSEGEAKAFADGQMGQYDYAYVSQMLNDRYVLWTRAAGDASCFSAQYHEWQQEEIRR